MLGAERPLLRDRIGPCAISKLAPHRPPNEADLPQLLLPLVAHAGGRLHRSLHPTVHGRDYSAQVCWIQTRRSRWAPLLRAIASASRARARGRAPVSHSARASSWRVLIWSSALVPSSATRSASVAGATAATASP